MNFSLRTRRFPKPKAGIGLTPQASQAQLLQEPAQAQVLQPLQARKSTLSFPPHHSNQGNAQYRSGF
jgi:hypothetical protein